jgi:hypothetical protein
MINRIYRCLFALVVFQCSSVVFAQTKTSIATSGDLFFDNFKNDSTGDFPKHWLGNAKASVELNKTYQGKWLRFSSQGTFSPVFEKPLPESFVVEFDFIHEVNGSGNNSMELTCFNQRDKSSLDADFPGHQGVKLFFAEGMISYLCYSNPDLSENKAGENRSVSIELHKKTKIRIEIQKKMVTVLINGGKVLEIQRSQRQQESFSTLRFNLWGSVAEPLIGNFRISDGNPSSRL